MYCEYKVTFTCGLTADSRLHIAKICRYGSLVELCELTWIKLLRFVHFCWLDAMRGAGVGMALWCWPPKKLSSATAVIDWPSSSSAWTGRMLSDQRTDNNNACVDVLEGTAVPYHWRSWRKCESAKCKSAKLTRAETRNQNAKVVLHFRRS